MKTAISLPDKLFESADALARRLGLSRSQLVATALAARKWRCLVQDRRREAPGRIRSIARGAEACGKAAERSLTPA